MMPSNHLILCCPLFLLPLIFPSISVFSSDSALPIRWPKYWSFSFSISPSNIFKVDFFRIDWLHVLKSRHFQESYPAPQFKSISSSVLSLLHGPTLTSQHSYQKKNIALTTWAIFSKVMSFFCNVLSRFVIV